ncbi:ATP-binding protein [uncultured Tateyamaria sp.]|uniref:hybrid sensor histidine kinase/response regulator n=1 Tax=uncultured Tateyamaria sp. TaxID=455651 RepID=UPI002632D4EE|nr:ATP-binding protein [uncultured Tateyamaria sp.]
MKAGPNRYRVAILAGFGLLILLLGIMATNLVSQLRDLSMAAGDNTQWSIAQLDTEFANLNATLSDQLSDQDLAADDIGLRIDIALSRLAIINSGRAAEIFGKNDDAPALIAPINQFAAEVIDIVDRPGPLAIEDIRIIRDKVREVRPEVRSIALLGVRLGAEQSKARRAEFSQQLSRTGGIAIALLIAMAAFLIVLDRLLQRAVRRDSELLTSSRQLEATVGASLDAIVTADDAGRIIGFNAAAEQVFGWSRNEILGLTMEDTFIPHRMRDAHHNGMKRYLSTGKPRVVDAGRVELAALRKSGEEFPVELNITTAEDAGRTTFIAYIRDISARKINEQQLIDARDKAQRTDRAKSQFLTVMSHEMRTPLNGILGVLDLLKTTTLDARQKRYTDIATSSGEVLLEHINEALDITRIETGALQLTPQDFDLPDLMAGLMDVFGPLAREKQLGLSLKMDDAVKMAFHSDSNRLRQILTNLIGNAIKFTDAGRVSVHVSGIHGAGETALRIAVLDTGAGIAPDQQDQIFEDFVALAHGEGRQTRGDGLGLSISRRIAREMGGDIALTSARGRGSTFTLTLPVTRPKSDAPEAPVPPEVPAEPVRACSVLVVEDNAINRKVLGDMLEGMGHSVLQAVHGAEGLELAATETFDLIFMDISMPVMDGIEATQKLRAGDGPNALTHIVGLTAHGREEYRDAAERVGMNRFHTKPIRLDALHSILADITAAAFPSNDGLNVPDALTELMDALGTAKVSDIADSFFAELAAFIAAARATDDGNTLAEHAHKMKGAAALLGQSSLESPLADFEKTARAGALDDSSARADALEQIAAQARNAFDQALATHPKT